MSMLARYKKAGGLLELVKLIEESAEPKRSQLMAMVASEDADFAAQVQARIYSYEKLRSLPEGLIAEIISVTPPKFVALALIGESEDFIKQVEKCLGKNFAEYKVEKEIFQEKPPGDAQVETARRKWISEARKLEKEGRLRLPEGGGAVAAGGAATSSTAAAPAENVTGAAPALGNTNTQVAVGPDGSRAPDIKSFGIEAPPPGLSGERFETFLKNQLGK